MSCNLCFVFLLGKGVLEPCSESNVNLKEQDKIKSEETKELTKAINELTTTIRKLQETLQTKPDLLEMVPLKEEKDDTQEKKDEDSNCCLYCEEAKGDNDYTIFVKGFENLRPRNEIKKMLSSVFGKCGKIARVIVPFECKTGLPLGFAFINFEFETGAKEIIEKALEFNGPSLEGRQLLVTMASKRGETYGFTNFHGCDRCNSTPITGFLVSDDSVSEDSSSDDESP